MDHIGLNVTSDDVGHNVTVQFASDTHHLDFTVYTPECGQDVVPVPHKACEKAQCPKGHENTQPKGHTMCQGKGHIAECSGAANGVQDEDSVTFQPTTAGVFVIAITFDAKSFKDNEKGGNDDPCRTGDCSCIECDQICSETCVESSPSSSDGGSGGGSGGTTIQSCHVTCASEAVAYDIATFDDDTVTFVS